MTSRADSAAATRRALLDAAADLLGSGGLDAVTLRAVGARAGVSRGAPYRHFPDKESLLIAVGTRAWDTLGDRMQALRADPGPSPAEKIRGGLIALIDIGRSQPHLYKLMFSNPPGDPTALARAASAARPSSWPSSPTWSASRTPADTQPCSSAARTGSPAWRPAASSPTPSGAASPPKTSPTPSST